MDIKGAQKRFHEYIAATIECFDSGNYAGAMSNLALAIGVAFLLLEVSR